MTKILMVIMVIQYVYELFEFYFLLFFWTNSPSILIQHTVPISSIPTMPEHIMGPTFPCDGYGC